MRIVACWLVIGTTLAHADPAAEKLFQDGRALMKEGKYDDACDAFRRSQEIEPRAGTLLNLGDCEEKRGHIATAWDVFTQARTLAKQARDKTKSDAAEQRIKPLAKKLPYLTVKSPPTKPDGFAVKREGKDVLAAELDREVPIDPGNYAFEVSAPGYVTWTGSVAVVAGKKATIEIPPLSPAPTPAVESKPIKPIETATAPVHEAHEPALPPTTTEPAISAAAPNMVPTTHHLGIGAAVGFSTDGDLIFGGRVPLQLAVIGRGAIRAVPTLFYADIDDPNDVNHILKLYALGLGVEYTAPLSPNFYVAAGAGIGVDLLDDNYQNTFQKHGWGAARLSPTLRIGPALDIGLHLQAVVTSSAVVGLGELGVDYFFW